MKVPKTAEVAETPVSGSFPVGYGLVLAVPRALGNGFGYSKFEGYGKCLCKLLRRKRLELLLSEMP